MNDPCKHFFVELPREAESLAPDRFQGRLRAQASGLAPNVDWVFLFVSSGPVPVRDHRAPVLYAWASEPIEHRVHFTIVTEALRILEVTREGIGQFGHDAHRTAEPKIDS